MHTREPNDMPTYDDNELTDEQYFLEFKSDYKLSYEDAGFLWDLSREDQKITPQEYNKAALILDSDTGLSTVASIAETMHRHEDQSVFFLVAEMFDSQEFEQYEVHEKVGSFVDSVFFRALRKFVNNELSKIKNEYSRG